MRLSRLLLALAVLLIALPAYAGFLMIFSSQSHTGGVIHYVDSGAGNDSNNGLSPATAWASVTPVNALTNIHAGDQILFKSGATFAGRILLQDTNYAGTNAPTALNPLIVSNYGGSANAIIATGTGNATQCIVMYQIGAFQISNFTCTGNGRTGQATVLLDAGALGSTLPAISLINVTVTGGTVGSDAISIGADAATTGFTGVTLANNTLTNNAGYGIEFYVTGGGTTQHHSNVVIQGNSITGSGNAGMLLTWINTALVQNNFLSGNGITTGAAAGIEEDISTGFNIQFNEVMATGKSGGTDGEGIDLDEGSQSSVVQYNYTHSNWGAGYSIFQLASSGAWSNNKIRYNISQNDALTTASFGSITLGASGATFTGTNQIYNNTIYQGGGTASSALAVYPTQGVASMSTFTIANNIFMVTSNAFLFQPNATFTPAWTQDYNDYCPISGSTCGGTFKLKWGATTYSSFATFQSGASQEANGLNVWPALSNAGGGGTTNGYNPGSLGAYKLTGGSPMIGVGFAFSSPGAQDYFGDTIPNGTGTGYNIGADGSSPAPAVPTAPQITSPAGGSTVTTASATISGTGGANGDTINITLDGVTTTSAATLSANSWTYNTASLTNASHTVTATETNITGTSTASNSVIFTTNAGTAPAAPVILGPTGTVTTTQATINGTGAANTDTINVCIDGTLTGATCSNSPGGGGTSTVNSSLAWTFNTSPLPNSNHTAVASETNSFGTSPSSNTVNFTTNVTVSTPNTLDPAKTSSSISLDSAHLTAVVNSTANAFPQSLVTNGYSTGKFHFEMQLNGSGAAATAVGLAQASPAHLFTTQAGFDTTSIAFYGSSGLGTYYNSVLQQAGPPTNAGDLIAIEVDIGAGLMWAKDVTTNSNWNNSGTANPGTGTGGVSFTPAGATWYALLAPPNAVVATRSQTMNFGATSFAAQCSTNFTAWNGSLTACPAVVVPPNAPSITSPTTGATITTASATISGTGHTAGDLITLTVDGSPVSPTTTVTAGNTWTYGTAPLTNASHTVTATEGNSAGNSGPSNSVTFTTNVVVVTTYTLDPSNKSSSMTLSNGNLTATVSSTANAFPQALSTLGHSTGKYHLEMQLTGTGGSATAIGLATSTHLLTTQQGFDTSSIGFYGSTGLGTYYNSIQQHAGPVTNAGDKIAIEVDVGAGLFWAQDVTTNSGWNGGGTANPATGVGGVSFTPGGSTWLVDLGPPNSVVAGRSQTINFGGSAFAAQCSSGFVAWDTTSTACPSGPPPSGTGLSTPVSLLPSDLPVTHWHTPARPWTALGTTAANYLTRLNTMANWFASQVGSNGCLVANIYPYYSQASAGSGGSLPMSIGAQLAGGNTANISAGASSPGIKSMNCDAAAFTSGTAQDQGFQMGPLNLAYQLYGTFGGSNVTAGEKSTWASGLNSYAGQGTNVNNQTTFGMWGAWLAIQNGFSAYTSSTGTVKGTAGIDCEWTGATCSFNTNTINQSAAFNDSPFGLYQDSTAVSPNSMQVERQSTTLLLMSTEGYNGAQAGAITTATQKAAQSGLLMQSPDGSNAAGGRVDNHDWVDSGRQLTDDIMAQQLNVSNPFLAGQYQRGAYMSFNQQNKYLNTFCCSSATFFQVKNHFNPSLSIGSQFAGGVDYGYNDQQMYFLAGSYLYRSKSVVTEQPAPVEIGGYAFFANGFSQAVLAAGGTSVQLATSGQTSLTTFDTPTLWTALGIERIGRVNWETRIGPSDSGYWGGLGTQTSFAPTWITSGTSWTRLAQNPSTCSGVFTTTFANPVLTFGKVIWTCSGPTVAVTFTQNLTVTPDGVMSQTTCSGCPSTWGMTVPILTNDGTSGFGNTVTTTDLNSTENGVFKVTWPPTGDSQNYMTFTPGTTTAVNEGTQNAVSGILQSERVWTGSGSTSDATQIMFIYPASSGDPATTGAGNVHQTFTPTGTNTFTDTALGLSVTSGTTGTLYVGRVSAGGWSNAITVGGQTSTFNVPCNFIMTVVSGKVSSIESDRNVTVTIPNGVNGAHTNMNLTSYTRVTGL